MHSNNSKHVSGVSKGNVSWLFLQPGGVFTARTSDLVHDSSPHTQVVSREGGEYARRGSGAGHRQLASTERVDGICKRHIISSPRLQKHL